MSLFSPRKKPTTAMPPCVLLSILLLPWCGCNQNEGTLYDVTASLTDTTCGSGVVNDDDSWDFQVRLTLEDTTLTWYDVDNATSSEGTLTDGAFSVADANNYTVTEVSTTSRGCSVRRHDKYSGDATTDDDGAIEKLEGTIVLKYSVVTGYDCDDLIGNSDGFDDLPCQVEYDFVAKPD